MGKDPKDGCPDCSKTIQSAPSHFSGTAVAMPQMMRCVLYEMYMLASSSGALKTSWPREMIHKHPQLGSFSPSEALKRSALISFRLLQDFLYNPNSQDDFSIDQFLPCGAIRPIEPAFVGLEKGKAFTRKSINKWVAHLTWVRINKPHCVPQPKFLAGSEAIVKNARLLLADAKAFVESLIDDANPNRVELDEHGRGYWEIFKEAFDTLET